MKNILHSVCALTVMLCFMACPYKATVPIDEEPKEKVSAQILGMYEKKNSTSYTYEIKKKDAYHYELIRTSTKEDSKSKPSVYIAYTSTIGGKKYLQMYREAKYSSNKDYYLYRMSSNSSKTILSLEPVTEHIKEKFTTSRELKSFIVKHQDLSFFFGKTEKYYRSE